MSVVRATTIGATAVLLWSTLALLTVLSGQVPPLQLTAMAFTIATLLGWIYIWRKGSWQQLRQLPFRVWLLGIYGLFGYHLLYFVALDNAPAVEANLLNYLWPLLIVLFSALLPDDRLRWFHIGGALLGFGGAALLVVPSGDDSLALEAQYLVGYAAAVGCALVWSSYSVLSRYFGGVPSTAVGGFCGATAVLAWVTHFLFETTIVPSGVEWLAIILLGLGPVGGAFFVWDVGMKQGRIKLLGTLAYAAPLLSTLLLIGFGMAEVTPAVAAACLLIVAGAFLSTGRLTRPWRRSSATPSSH